MYQCLMTFLLTSCPLDGHVCPPMVMTSDNLRLSREDEYGSSRNSVKGHLEIPEIKRLIIVPMK